MVPLCSRQFLCQREELHDFIKKSTFVNAELSSEIESVPAF
ncbi:hypothetical protein BH10CYA1_BH10CYA1_53890 [soil metagenome]